MNFSKTISVSLVNACGPGKSRSKVIRAAPKAPAPITGQATICNGDVKNYSISPVDYATSYTWVAPTGAHITANGVTSSGNSLTTTSTSVTVTFASVINGQYIKVRASNSCGDGGFRALYLTPCSPRLEDIISDFKIYPNPATEKLYINVNADINTVITCIDASGRIIKSWNPVNTKEELDLNGWPAGLYFITVKSNDYVKSLTFMKE